MLIYAQTKKERKKDRKTEGEREREKYFHGDLMHHHWTSRLGGQVAHLNKSRASGASRASSQGAAAAAADVTTHTYIYILTGLLKIVTRL